MKYLYYLILSVLMLSCHQGGDNEEGCTDSAAVVRRLCNEATKAVHAEDADSAFTLLLKAEPYLFGVHNDDIAYTYYDMLARLYESKNLFELQKLCLREKLKASTGESRMAKQATTYFELGVAHYAQLENDSAVMILNQAIRHTPPDSISLIARSYLMLSHVYLQKEENDSATTALQHAAQVLPSITDESVFRLAEVYLLHNRGENEKAKEKISSYLPESDLYGKIELTTLLSEIHEEEGAYASALDDFHNIISYNDSAFQLEASENTAKIHKLRHEEQMRSERLKQEKLKAESRAKTMTWISLFAIAIAAGGVVSVWLVRRARHARLAELEALRLAENALMGEAEMRSMNQELQKRYYSHLYAIILPILNTKRTKTGYIDLNEKSWRLIEENTNLVLPQFTRKLRKSHPSLGDEDVRFCCLVAMQVPNPVIANIYGIAPSSVAVRKQRMKKKLDEAIVNETLENYLSKYST